MEDDWEGTGGGKYRMKGGARGRIRRAEEEEGGEWETIGGETEELNVAGCK